MAKQNKILKNAYSGSLAEGRMPATPEHSIPSEPKPQSGDLKVRDSVIVRAEIHPAIGIARLGDSLDKFYIGPEVVAPPDKKVGFYRDGKGALKRQVARFHIYGYNASDEVVNELTAANADIQWTVHLANKKAAWYQFQAPLDVTDAATMSVPQRNPAVRDAKRSELVIDPGPRSISGTNVSGGAEHLFDTGKFKGTTVLLGEIRTDKNGCLLIFGGNGISASPSGARIYNPVDPNSFNNADDWYDDISDGPVTATVSINSRQIPVEAAWVTVAPPNYAPHIIGWRTLYDLLVEVYTECQWMQTPKRVSFTNHILPILSRLSNLQWVNEGFAALFGKGRPMDFDSPGLIAKLSMAPHTKTKEDPYRELRQAIFNSFRPASNVTNEPLNYDQGKWPWLYGDSHGSFSATSPNNNLPLPSLRHKLMSRWAIGDFVNDWNPSRRKPLRLSKVSLSKQPTMLDEAALHFCLADAFHPGCEMTWPMRHVSMYKKPFRILHRPAARMEPKYGSQLTQQAVLKSDGPLYAQGPGDLTRWMALPWQGDTGGCRSGYDPDYDPYVPALWPARVPNQVLTEEDYETLMNDTLPREQRIAAFNRRHHWFRALLKGSPVHAMTQMVAHFGAMGIVEARPGFKDDPDFPETIYVESLAGSRLKENALKAALLARSTNRPKTRLERAGWESREELEEFRRLRVRFRES